MVMAQSLYLTLKQQFPHVLIDVVAPPWSLPLLARMPQVDRGIELAVGHKQLGLSARWQLGKQLRDGHYYRAIVLPRSFKAALIPWFARVPMRVGYRGEMRFGLLTEIRALDPSQLHQTVQRFVALGCDASAEQPPPIPSPQLRVDPENQQRLLTQLNLKLTKSVVALMPGAEYGPAKQWPLAHFRELAQRCTAANYQVWILGSAKESAAGEFIAQGVADVHNLCGKTNLVDAVDLLAMSRYAVTNDSGLMHIACATGVTVVALYGSSTPHYTPPLSASAKVIYHALPCSPCFARTCRFGHTNCLTQIQVDEVMEALSL